MTDDGRLGAFVGREQPLAAFASAVDAAQHSLPSALLIAGEAGIGKSSFVNEATRRTGVELFVARCPPHGGDAIPLAALVDLVRQVRRRIPSDRIDTLTPLLTWLSPTVDRPVALDAGRLFSSVLDLADALAADAGAVLAFEDLHWADTETWSLFEFLVRNAGDEKLLIVGTFRPDDLNRDLAKRRRLVELSRLPQVQRVALSGLGRDEVAEHVAVLTGRTPPAPLIDAVMARGEGNPFFTEQLVAAHLADEDIPDLLSDLIAADLAEIDDDTRAVLAAIAVRSRGISHDLLSRLTDVAGPSLERAIRSALDQRLLVVDQRSEEYVFRHALIGEVVYHDLLPPERARLHHRLAEILGEQSESALARADRAGELAFHLDRAGDRPGAFTASLAAADAAMSVAPAAAFAHLQLALELWDDVGPVAVGEDRAQRMWQAAELASSVASNRHAAELARGAFAVGTPPHGEAWGHERLGRYLWSSGQLPESRIEYERAAQLLHPDAPFAAMVFAGLAQDDLMAARFDTAERRALDAITAAGSATDDPLTWATAMRVLGVVASGQGDAEVAMARCREAVASAPNAQARALTTLYLCVVLLDAGENDVAINTALDAVAEGHVTGVDASFGAYIDALAADGLTRVGRWNDAEHLLARHTDETALPIGRLRVARTRALLAARRGDTDLADAARREMHAVPVDGWHRALVGVADIEIALASGAWADAVAAAEVAWKDRPDSVLWTARIAGLGAHGVAEHVLDARAGATHADEDELVGVASARLADAEALAGDGPSTREIRALLAHGRAALGRLSEPDPDLWRTAADAWRALGDVWWLAVAQLREGEAAVANGAAARASDAVRGAHQLAVSLGAKPLVDEVEAVARRARISLESPVRADLGSSGSQHGLTPAKSRCSSSSPWAGATVRSATSCTSQPRPPASMCRTFCASSASPHALTPLQSHSASRTLTRAGSPDLRGRARCGLGLLRATVNAPSHSGGTHARSTQPSNRRRDARQPSTPLAHLSSSWSWRSS